MTEDGHGFKIYFLYTLLSLPKIFNEILPFMFFFAVFFTLVKYEDQNQTLIFWSNGIKKSDFLNIIINSTQHYFYNIWNNKNFTLRFVLY